MDSSLQLRLDAEWQKLIEKSDQPQTLPGVMWSYCLTPPLPSDWPPTPDLRLIYYAFAYGRDFGRLMDAVRVAAPWARVEKYLSESLLPKTELIADAIREIGIQGVRPISRDEVVVSDSGAPIESLLARLSGSLDENLTTRSVKEYYRFWQANNGVVAGEIQPRHGEFFRWVAGK